MANQKSATSIFGVKKLHKHLWGKLASKEWQRKARPTNVKIYSVIKHRNISI